MTRCLEEAIRAGGIDIKSSMIRVNAGMCPGHFVLAEDPEEDSLLLSLLKFENVGSKIRSNMYLRQPHHWTTQAYVRKAVMKLGIRPRSCT